MLQFNKKKQFYHARFLETHLVEELKKDTYTSLEALNAAVKKIVADINQRPFQKKSDIRKSRRNGFEKYEKPRMNQLPGEGLSSFCVSFEKIFWGGSPPHSHIYRSVPGSFRCTS